MIGSWCKLCERSDHLSIEGIRKEYLLSQKSVVHKRVSLYTDVILFSF